MSSPWDRTGIVVRSLLSAVLMNAACAMTAPSARSDVELLDRVTVSEDSRMPQEVAARDATVTSADAPAELRLDARVEDTADAPTEVSRVDARVEDAADAPMEGSSVDDPRSCASAPTLSDGAVMEGITSTEGGERVALCGETAAAPRWYRVDVPPGHRIEVSVTGMSVVGTRIALMDRCDAQICTPPTHAYESLRDRFVQWDHEGAEPRALRVAVWGARVPWSLRVRVRPIPDAARCATAPVIVDGERRTSEPLRAFSERVSNCFSNGASGRLYRARVPAGQRIEVTATGAGQGFVRAEILGGCPRGACLAEGGSYHQDRVAVGWTNPDPTPRDVFVVVHESHGVGTDPPPEVDVSVSIRPLVAHGVCARSLSLRPDVAHTDTLGDAQERVTPCGSGWASAPALFYRLTVPPGERLRLRWSRAGDLMLSVYVMGDCSAATCLARTPSERIAPQVAQWTNPSGASREVVVAAMLNVHELGPFTLTPTFETPATNGRCVNARRVRDGETIADARQADADEPTAICEEFAGSGPALHYAMEVPAARRLVVTATDDRGLPVRIALRDGCAGECLARAASGPLSWRNDGPLRSVILAVLGRDPPWPEASYRVAFRLE